MKIEIKERSRRYASVAAHGYRHDARESTDKLIMKTTNFLILTGRSLTDDFSMLRIE